MVGWIYLKSGWFSLMVIWISNMSKFIVLLILLHLSFADVSIRNGKVTLPTNNMCYQDAITQEIERLVLSDNPVYSELEPDILYEFTLEGTKESRYLLFTEGRFTLFKEDGKIVNFEPENFMIRDKCGPNKFPSRTFTPTLYTFTPLQHHLHTSNLITPPSTDVTSEKKWFDDKEFCFCLAWSILLIFYKFYEQWTHSISSQDRSIEISKRGYDNIAINENQNPRRSRKVPRRYLSRWDKILYRIFLNDSDCT